MDSFTLRPLLAGDAPDAVSCWERSFGDSAEFVRDLFASAALPDNALCAESGGHVRCLMFAFDGISFHGIRASYLYALCTQPEYRGLGMGRAVCLGLARQCFGRGAELVFLRPADAGLETWYTQTMGMEVLARVQTLPAGTAEPVPGLHCEKISGEEYARCRAGAEPGITGQLIRAQDCLHRHFGGGFYRIALPEGGEALACADLTEDAALVRELLCPEKWVEASLTALSGEFAGRHLKRLRPSRDGAALLFLRGEGKGCYSGSRTLFPFTLD